MTTTESQIEKKHIFVGQTNGHLMKLDPEKYYIMMRVKLKHHIYCMLQLDNNSILCGQLHGQLDLVRIRDGEILMSENLKSKMGHIVSMLKTNRPNEVAFATKQGIFLANVGRGNMGLKRLEFARMELHESLMSH